MPYIKVMFCLLQGLVLQEAEAAVAAGTNTMLLGGTTAAVCQLQALSPVGRCKSFDSSGDGYGRGEGFAATVLCRASQAASDHTLAVLYGSAINQDGRSSGLTAPNGPSQGALVRAARANGGVSAAEIGWVSVHGTGTPLGDPIEVGALGGGLSDSTTAAAAPIALVSNKSCYGHTEGTAGLSGLLLAVTLVQQELHAPVMHLRNLNVHVAAAIQDWRKSQLTANIPVQPQGAAPFLVHVLASPSHVRYTDSRYATCTEQGNNRNN